MKVVIVKHKKFIESDHEDHIFEVSFLAAV